MLKYNCAQVQKVYVSLTQLVEVCVNPVRSRYGADQSGFDEGTPFVHQNSLASNIILAENRVHTIYKTQLHINFKTQSFIALALYSSMQDLDSNNLRLKQL